MKIAIIGTGYVGLVSGACFSDLGIDVTCVDVDRDKVAKLKEGIVPIYEPGLEEIILKNSKEGRLRFTTDVTENIDSYDAVFCAVGTPSDEDGSADLKHVLEVARTVGRSINSYVLFVTKSTVPVGTGAKVREVIGEELSKRGVSVEFDVVSNPEFLKEGDAVNDFLYPDRVVVGVESDRARDVMCRLYKPFEDKKIPIIFTDIPSAEMIKYASNAMLATRISFMNDIANLCELLGADVDMVRSGIGSDSRIGSKFLYPGIGYGGSCFPKDAKALIHTAESAGYDMQVLKAVEKVNARQKTVLFEKFKRHFAGNISGRTVALWGLSFKPETDDMREAPSIVLIDLLLEAGCRVKAYDPIATDECRKRFGDKIEYCSDKYVVTNGVDALMLVTEWSEFRDPEWSRLSTLMKESVVFDGRNIFDRAEAASFGFVCYSIGHSKI